MQNYKTAAIDLAYRAGKIMRKNFALGVEKTWKADDTPLTETDTAINSLVIRELSKQFPNFGIIGEEESLKKDSEFQWVCDPLDGTFPFSHGYPIFTFALALVKDGEPIVGVIYDPVMDRLFHAEKGKGAFLNKKKIKVCKQKNLNKNCLLEVNAFHTLQKIYSKILEKSFITSFLSAAYSSGLVASGELVANVYDYINPWDGAAGKIIVEEAGGKVTDIFGNEQRYDQKINGFVASNGSVHEELVNLCKTAMK